ncbi:MAG: hypothetical protein HZC43_03085 [Nitrosomonadales bacterium]|nr:hypothetical protein [Nitrosomonadales bacterium]
MNRVTASGNRITGTLMPNGHIFLTNPGGVITGGGGLTLNGAIATTGAGENTGGAVTGDGVVPGGGLSGSGNLSLGSVNLPNGHGE